MIAKSRRHSQPLRFPGVVRHPITVARKDTHRIESSSHIRQEKPSVFEADTALTLDTSNLEHWELFLPLRIDGLFRGPRKKILGAPRHP